MTAQTDSGAHTRPHKPTPEQVTPRKPGEKHIVHRGQEQYWPFWSRPSGIDDMARTPRDGCIHVVIEIPRGSRNKYEIDHETHQIFLDRRLFSATVYPADYGFIPNTLGEDGDPLDALVLLEDPTFPGIWVEARPVGVMWMQDEAGPDAKIICVPPTEPRWKGVEDLRDLPEELLEEIKHFFDVYKMLEPDKQSSTAGFEGARAAWREINASIEREKKNPTHSMPTDKSPKADLR